MMWTKLDKPFFLSSTFYGRLVSAQTPLFEQDIYLSCDFYTQKIISVAQDFTGFFYNPNSKGCMFGDTYVFFVHIPIQ